MTHTQKNNYGQLESDVIVDYEPVTSIHPTTHDPNLFFSRGLRTTHPSEPMNSIDKIKNLLNLEIPLITLQSMDGSVLEHYNIVEDEIKKNVHLTITAKNNQTGELTKTEFDWPRGAIIRDVIYNNLVRSILDALKTGKRIYKNNPEVWKEHFGKSHLFFGIPVSNDPETLRK